MRAAGIVFPTDKTPQLPKRCLSVPAVQAPERDTERSNIPQSFRQSAWPRHRVTEIVALDYFTKLKPLTWRVASRLIHRSLTEPLWIWPVTTRTKGAWPHNCATSLMGQRIKRAFRVALKMHGYDANGRRVQKSSDKPEQLYGTIVLRAEVVEAIKAENNAIVEYYHRLLDQLIPELGCASGEMPFQPTRKIISKPPKTVKIPKKSEGKGSRTREPET
ncbi:hypothetical protein PspLS_07913 [Pyricularia sp. CBS 133598]|nr:hypothetical protein PspLS_07913 [Pyricularia sp. CBS 133598]